MPNNKSHHFVPQFLLKLFASDERRRHLCLFRVAERDTITCASIRHQCARDYLYGKAGDIEHLLSEMEGRAAVVVRALVAGGRVPEPGSAEMRDLLVFAMFQWARTPVAVARQEAFATAMYRQVLKSDPKIRAKFGTELDTIRARARNRVGDAFFSAARDWLVLRDLRLKVLRNDSPVEFIIGDAPAVLHNQWCRRTPTVGSIGLACAGLLLALPLSPTHLALLYDTDVYQVGPEGDDVVGVTDPADVQGFNSLQFAAADHGVFFSSVNAAAQVAQIPIAVRENRLGVNSGRFAAEDGSRSTLVAVENVPLNVDLKRGVVQARFQAYSIPPRERPFRWRPEAQAMIEVMREVDEAKGSRRRTPPPRIGRTFKRVED